MKQAKMQICLFIVLLAGLTGCGSTAKKAEVTNSPEPSVSYEQGADFVGAVGAVDEEQGTMEFYNTTFQTMETYPYTGGTQILTKNNKQMKLLYYILPALSKCFFSILWPRSAPRIPPTNSSANPKYIIQEGIRDCKVFAY